jgi:hypothetical protein
MPSHTKQNSTRVEEFYKERVAKRPKNRQLTLVMSDSEIRSALENITAQQIAALLTLAYNTYEDEYHHIWFAHDVRMDHMDLITRIINHIRDFPFVEPLDQIFTSLGNNDRSLRS